MTTLPWPLDLWVYMAMMLSIFGMLFLLITLLMAAFEGRTESTKTGLQAAGFFFAAGIFFPVTALAFVGALFYGAYRAIRG